MSVNTITNKATGKTVYQIPVPFKDYMQTRQAVWPGDTDPLIRKLWLWWYADRLVINQLLYRVTL